MGQPANRLLPGRETRMTKRSAIVDRVLLGFIFVLPAIQMALGAEGEPESEAARTYLKVLGDTGLLNVLVVIQCLAGVALLTGRFVPLAVCVLAPIVFNIVFFHATLDPIMLPVAGVIAFLWATVCYEHRAAYALLLRPRPPEGVGEVAEPPGA